jgi:hypothetical protein
MYFATRCAALGRRFHVALAAAVTLFAAGAASALPPCPTWFPDFRCDRHGRYEGFVPPMMHPYLFEDPFITTGVSLWGLWHEFPDSSILEGGQLWDVALQARVAVTDRIAFIATKDGWVSFRPGNPLVAEDGGFTDITVGFKGSLIDDRKNNFILTPSLRYQIASGDHGVLQGNGSGVFIPDVSMGWGPFDRFHVIADFGGQFPVDTDAQSTSLMYHLHLDYALFQYFVPFAEIGGFSYLDGGDGSTKVRLKSGAHVPIGLAQSLLNKDPEEGLDYANVGSRVAGNNVVVWSVGFRVPVTEHLILGAAYERPATGRKDVEEQRATINATLEF